MNNQNSKIVILAVVLLLVGGFFLSGCAAEQQPDAPAADEPTAEAEPDAEEPSPEAGPDAEEEEEQLLTMDEIATYDGQDGRPAYIVVEGIVYDVTDVSQWRSGSHFGFSAGTDVTEDLASAAPHGANLLNQAEIVGRIAD